MRRYNKILEQLEALMEQESCVAYCDDTTCSTHLAFEHGYTRHAIDCWASSGAASDKFYRLLKKIPRNHLNNASIKEAELFCKEVSHVECKCGAYVWDYEWNNGYCSSCGGNALKGKGTK